MTLSHIDRAARDAYRELLDAKLSELMRYAKELCPAAVVEAKPSLSRLPRFARSATESTVASAAGFSATASSNTIS